MSFLASLDTTIALGHPHHVREDLEGLGNCVQERRIELGYTDRRDLAKVTGISDRTLGSIERGERRARPKAYMALEDALRWERGTCRRILGGSKPERADHASVDREIDVSKLPNKQLVEILTTLDRIHGRAAMLEAIAAIHRKSEQGGQLHEGRPTGTES